MQRFEDLLKREACDLNIKKVLVALSGGADSVTAAYLLKKAGLEIMALHCNFHLRGEESDRDMEFVKNFCHNNDIPLEIKDFDVDQYLKENPGTSVEMACRELRFHWFYKKLEETGYQLIATGHNADDNIETFFLNAFRGSGTRGLKGMVADNGKIWRPLLRYHRDEILQYLKDQNLSYIVDSTNLGEDFRRNFIRNRILPLLREEWKGFDKAMDKTIQNLESENSLLEQMLSDTVPDISTPFDTEIILNSPAPLLLIRRYIDPLNPFSTTPGEVLASIKAKKPHIRRWRLRNGDLILRNKKLFVEMSHGERSSR